MFPYKNCKMWRTLRISGREYDVSIAITEGGAVGMRALRRSSLSSLSSSTKTFFFKLPSHPAGEFTLRTNWVIVCWWSVTDDPAASSSATMVQKMGNMLDTWVDMTSKSGQDVMGGHECVQCAESASTSFGLSLSSPPFAACWLMIACPVWPLVFGGGLVWMSITFTDETIRCLLQEKMSSCVLYTALFTLPFALGKCGTSF